MSRPALCLISICQYIQSVHAEQYAHLEFTTVLLILGLLTCLFCLCCVFLSCCLVPVDRRPDPSINTLRKHSRRPSQMPQTLHIETNQSATPIISDSQSTSIKTIPNDDTIHSIQKETELDGLQKAPDNNIFSDRTANTTLVPITAATSSNSNTFRKKSHKKNRKSSGITILPIGLPTDSTRSGVSKDLVNDLNSVLGESDPEQKSNVTIERF